VRTRIIPITLRNYFAPLQLGEARVPACYDPALDQRLQILTEIGGSSGEELRPMIELETILVPSGHATTDATRFFENGYGVINL
jgi:hypothetical protein